jgi:hypothetical protein
MSIIVLRGDGTYGMMKEVGEDGAYNSFTVAALYNTRKNI